MISAIHALRAVSLPGRPAALPPAVSARAGLLALAAVLAAAPAAAGPPLALAGRAVQGGLLVGHVPPGSVLEAEGGQVGVSGVYDDGLVLVGLGRDAPPVVRLVLHLPGGTTVERQLAVGQRDYDIQHIEGLPPASVSPPPEVLARIRREAEAVRAARARDTPRADFLAGFAWPLEGPVTGVYGSQRILNGEPRQPHYGVDVAAPTGTPVRAPAAAVVTLAHPDMYYSGGTLVMDHGRGLTSTFIHLSRILVAEGERVERGQVVAEVGATGRATGPHLDWRMNLGEIRLDPALQVPPPGASGP